jgi:hypothetical protein
MRLAEARVTLGVVAARQDDPEQAVHYGEQALHGQHKSLPSLLMVSRDLIRVLKARYPPLVRLRWRLYDERDRSWPTTENSASTLALLFP